MANPGVANLQVPRGADWHYEVGWVDLVGDLVDMAGRQLQARVLATTYTPLLTMGLGASLGLVVLTLDAAATAGLPRLGRWELRQLLAGRQTTLLAGALVVPD